MHILEPREGIGGHRLPKDTKMFIESSVSIKSKILTAAIEVDQDYRRNYKQFRESKINEVLGQQQYHQQKQEVKNPIPISIT